MLKHCKVCGTEYDSCFSCEKQNSWRAHTDTADHYYILSVLMEYQSGHDAKKAYRALRKRGVDLRATDGYLPTIRKLLTEIYDIYHESGKAKQAAAVELAAASTEAEQIPVETTGEVTIKE